MKRIALISVQNIMSVHAHEKKRNSQLLLDLLTSDPDVVCLVCIHLSYVWWKHSSYIAIHTTAVLINLSPRGPLAVDIFSPIWNLVGKLVLSVSQVTAVHSWASTNKHREGKNRTAVNPGEMECRYSMESKAIWKLMQAALGRFVSQVYLKGH